MASGLLSSYSYWAHSPSSAQEQSPRTVIDEPKHVREAITTADFSRVKEQVDRLVAKHTEEQVLLVVDLDNTLLAMNQDLGSDQWFDWQSGLQRDHPYSPDLVATTFSGLLQAQGMLFALSGMHAPEPELPTLIKQIQEAGVTTVVLTSRGPELRNAAQRELLRNNYDFATSALHIYEKRGLFTPFDPNRPDTHGLSAEIIQKIESRLSPVTYANGIYMIAGQHKGYLLRTLLARAIPSRGTLHEARTFRAIVFVDDHERHTSACTKRSRARNLTS